VVDYEKLMNRTSDEKAQADKEIEKMKTDFLEQTKNDPSVKRMKRLMGEEVK
jgi:hypothetical protein